MKEEKNVERLFASARNASMGAIPSMPTGFAENILRQHRNRVQESKAFVRTSILSIATALIILGTVLGIDMGTTSLSGSDERDSTVELAYSLWDPAGN
jgi:hypothetical protein